MIRLFSETLARIVTVLALILAPVAVPTPVQAQNAAFQKIESLEFRDSSVGEAIRLISRLSGVNILATREAASREFSMVISDSTVKGVVASIARVTGLSYSYDEASNAFMLMTNAQFAGDVTVTRNAQTKVFNLRHQNVVSTAQVVENLFGDRVELEINTDDPDRLEISNGGIQTTRSVSGGNGGSNNNNNNNNNSRRSSGSSSNSENANLSELNAQRLQELINARGIDEALTESEIAAKFGFEPKIYITINREHNLLYVRTSDRAAMRDIERIIAQTDRPSKQVLLEVRVMSLSLGDDFRSFFNFGLTDGSTRSFTNLDGTTRQGRTGATLGAQAQSGNGLFFQFISDNLLAQIELLEQNNKAKTLSTPMLAASNNSPARLFVGTEAILARGFSSNTSVGSTGQATTNNSTNVELREVGQTLDILPRINADDTVTLVIQQENSTVVPDGGRLPVLNNSGNAREIAVDTVNTARVGGTVTTRTGTTIAVGGLIQDTNSRSKSKTPFLGDVPILGEAFKGRSKEKKRSELILLITPHIYSSGPEGERLARKRLAALSRNSSVDTEGFGGSKKGVPATGEAGQKQNYVALTRFAAAMRHGVKPVASGAYRGIVKAPVTSGGGMKMGGASGVTAEPVESWRKKNLYVTAVVLSNSTGSTQPVRLKHLQGSWLAATSEIKNLAPTGQNGSRGYIYLISDRPFDSVVAGLGTGGAL